MDPNVAKLIERSQARRGGLKDFSSDRSPLPSEKKAERGQRDRSPLKQINATRASSPTKSTVQSPLKSPVRKIEIEVEDSPSNTIRRILSRESLETNVRELIARDSPGKSVVTRVTSSKVESPNKTTYTKTVITEKEEKYEKKETISYSGNKEVLDTIKEKFDNLEKDSEKVKTYDSGTFTKRESSPTKFKPRLRQFSPSKAAPAPSPPKSASKPASNTEVDLGDWESGRKTRLANLASKFKTFDDDEPPVQREIQLPKPVTKPLPRAPSPSKHAPVTTDHIRSRSPVKASPHHNPNQFISPQVTKTPTKPGDNLRSSPVRSVRFVSPTKTPVLPTSPRKEPGEADFVSSLKAQGFQETDSKSKLVYKFDQQDSQPEKETTSRSPVRTSELSKTEEPRKERDRSVSPVRANPFLMREKQEQRQERGRSPTKKTVAQPRSYSPEKLHPLQFVTPGLSQGPPKPSRTFESQPATARVMESERVDSPAMLSVTKKREMFEAGAQVTPEAEKPDPAMMSLSQRKALFEKNKTVPTPIARFGESVTPAMLAKSKPTDTPSMTPAEAWKRKRPVSPVKQDMILSAVRHESSRRSPSKPSLATPKVAPAQAPLTEDTGTPHVGKKTGEMQKKLFQANNADWRGNDIAKKAAEEKQSEMNLLLNRYNHLRKHSEEPKPVSPVKEETTYYPGVSSMKRVRMSPPKPGSLYPSVDFESGSDRPESAMSTDTLNSSYESCVTKTSEAPSLGKDIVAAARIGAGLLQDQELSTIKEDNNDSMDTDDGEVMTDSIIGAEIDDMIDEAIDEDDDDVPTPPKMPKMSSSSSGSDGMGRSESTTSWEFHTPQPTRKHHPGRQTKYQTPLITTSAASPASPQKQVSIEGEDGPLLHTVSFYRKQKPPNTPVQRIVLNPSLETHSEVLSSPRATITQKIHQLQEEAASQLPVIQQASSAVNLCRSTNEFFGSSEQVEGERLLLVATHKRQTATTEIQRLKTEGGLGRDPNKDNSVRGTVSLCGINLGLKSEFVNLVRSGEAGEFIHYFLCLVKCAGQCIPTQMVSSSDGLDGCELHFPNLINFRDLDKDFSIQLEVYGLQTKKEHMPHDAKYHIKKGKSALSALTPKLKMSKTESRLARPNVSSPGGPHTVRTSSFAMVNFTSFFCRVCSAFEYFYRLETQSSPSTV